MIFLCVNIRYILFLLLTVALFIFIFSQFYDYDHFNHWILDRYYLVYIQLLPFALSFLIGVLILICVLF